MVKTGAASGRMSLLLLLLLLGAGSSITCHAGVIRNRSPTDAAADTSETGGARSDASFDTWGIGAHCTAPGDCESGFCFDGVCCLSDCRYPCTSCAVDGNVGVCINVPAGDDPRDDCQSEDVASCGRNGFCDGMGACASYVAGTVCRAESCSGSTVSHAARCDGARVCGTIAAHLCDPYTCDASSTACRDSCASNADCVGGASCLNGSCSRKSPGATCTDASECVSGFCAQSVCCLTDCDGTCRSCAIPGSLGICVVVPAGPDPLDDCADDRDAGCGDGGACDGG
jgi:hypothetical protein